MALKKITQGIKCMALPVRKCSYKRRIRNDVVSKCFIFVRDLFTYSLITPSLATNTQKYISIQVNCYIPQSVRTRTCKFYISMHDSVIVPYRMARGKCLVNGALLSYLVQSSHMYIHTYSTVHVQ